MRVPGLMIVGVAVVVAVGALLLAQAQPGTPPAPAAADTSTLFQQAVEQLKAGRYTDVALAADQLLSLDSADSRGLYLKQAADYYSKGQLPVIAPPPPPPEPGTGTGTGTGTTTGTGTGTGNADTGSTTTKAPGGAVIINLSDADVETVYREYGAQRMAQFKTLQGNLFANRCATQMCHGNAEKSGPFYLKMQNPNDRKTIAENFKAVMNYVNNAQLADSRILTMALAAKEQHPGGPALRERDAQYTELKNFVTSLPGLFGK